MSTLFSPIKVGPYDLSHRVVLAPMTRLRTIQPHDIPSPMMADFYGQRASEGGLEVIEGVSISIPARSYLIRNFLMLRTAWRMRCSFSTSAMRTWPSPYSP